MTKGTLANSATRDEVGDTPRALVIPASRRTATGLAHQSQRTGFVWGSGTVALARITTLWLRMRPSTKIVPATSTVATLAHSRCAQPRCSAQRRSISGICSSRSGPLPKPSSANGSTISSEKRWAYAAFAHPTATLAGAKPSSQRVLRSSLCARTARTLAPRISSHLSAVMPGSTVAASDALRAISIAAFSVTSTAAASRTTDPTRAQRADLSQVASPVGVSSITLTFVRRRRSKPTVP